MNLSNIEEKKINQLLLLCKEKQGEYRLSHHGSGSWATTYSNEFIAASAEIYVILKKDGANFPLNELSNRFRELGIRSCRGAIMTVNRVEYLYETHLLEKIIDKKQYAKPTVHKKICPYCEIKFVDVIQHVSQAHPKRWDEYSLNHGVIASLGIKKRCKGCGSFLKLLDEHKEKCPNNLLTEK